jgi:hypothetical protein
MRVSALALPLLVALAIAAAWPTPALAASEASQPSKSSAVKPAPIEPVAPQVFEGDVRDLPKAERWKPGDPVREGPRLRERSIPQKEGIPPRPSGPWGEPRLELKEKVSKGEEARILSTPVPNGPEGKSRGCEY